MVWVDLKLTQVFHPAQLSSHSVPGTLELWIYSVSLRCFFNHICICVHTHTSTARMWRTEDNFQDSFLSFRHASPSNPTQVIGLAESVLPDEPSASLKF